MAKLSLDLNKFKSAGVYTIEVDQSERIVVSSQSLRLVPGFSEVGPQNTPVFISSTDDLYKFYGNKNTQLERKGSYFHRTIETCLLSSPVFAISLLNADTRATNENTDIVGMSCWSVDTSNTSSDSLINGVSDKKYYQLFDRSRFWTPSAENLQNLAIPSSSDAEDASIIQIANVGTKDFSVIISKPSNLKKYDVLVKDWYGNISNIPYKWLKPYNYISDYFINVLVIEGKHGTISIDNLNQLISSNSVNVIGNWVGTIIPDFRDAMGSNLFIEDIVNSNVSITNVLMNINKDALEFNDEVNVDLIGENIAFIADEDGDIIDMLNSKFLSYNINIDKDKFETDYIIIEPNDVQKAKYGEKSFIITSTELKNKGSLNIGDFIVHEDSIIRISNKLYLSDIGDTDKNSGYIFNTISDIDITYELDAILKVNVGHITKRLPITSLATSYDCKFHKGLTLTKHHKPGFSGNYADSQPNVEEGVSKIYGMLMDSGILRGLINPDMISYRYIVDSMGFGLRPLMGGKHYLSLLAKKRGKCTAIISAPAIKQFAKSQDPYFCDEFSASESTPVFNTKWIGEGGNPNMIRSFRFTLPDEDNGSKYCGVFGPYLKYNDNGKTINVPPAADVSNAYLRKFLGGDPYAIVANRNGLLSNPNILGIEYMLDKEDRDYLEPIGYNSIIEKPKSGEVMIYANATSYQTINSDFNYLHVREILNTIEIEVEDILNNFVFGRNNDVNRLTAINSITPILQAMQDSGALYKFEVTMDSSNNTDAIVDEGFAIVDIGVWITKGMEKIIQRISVNKLDTTSSGGSVNA